MMMNHIEKESIENKLKFISDVISQTDIPTHFSPLPYTIAENLFFRSINGQHEPREWIIFENQQFYCAYCLCFSGTRNDLFVKGIEYAKNCRITGKLKRHDTSSHHQLAKTTYSNLVSNGTNDGMSEHQSKKRNAIKIIVKIIIYLVTHGENGIITNVDH